MVAVCGVDQNQGVCMCVCLGVIRVKVALSEVIRVMVAVCVG